MNVCVNECMKRWSDQQQNEGRNGSEKRMNDEPTDQGQVYEIIGNQETHGLPPISSLNFYSPLRKNEE
jgi:hypothetical protein